MVSLYQNQPSNCVLGACINEQETVLISNIYFASPVQHILCIFWCHVVHCIMRTRHNVYEVNICKCQWLIHEYYVCSNLRYYLYNTILWMLNTHIWRMRNVYPDICHFLKLFDGYPQSISISSYLVLRAEVYEYRLNDFVFLLSLWIIHVKRDATNFPGW